MKKSVARIFTLSILLSSSASAALIEAESSVVIKKLFTTEIKIDQNITESGTGGQRGNDIFLRKGELFQGPSANYNWNADFDYNESFDWSLSLSETGQTTLVFDDVTLQNSVEEGTWNGLEFWINQTGRKQMSDVSVTTTIDGQVIELPEGTAKGGFTFALADFAEFTSISGTLNFNWAANGNVNSPNSRVALSLKALELEPASVPAPATALLSLFGFGLLASRRIKK